MCLADTIFSHTLLVIAYVTRMVSPCHAECSEASRAPPGEILRFAQDDRVGKAERQVGEHFRLANVWHGWSRLVMLSAAKHLVPHRVRSFALLRMTSEADGSAVAR